MAEIFLKFIESINKDEKILRNIMFIALFFCISFLLNINQSFIEIWKTIFNFDLTNILLILFRYLIFAYTSCCIVLIVMLFLFILEEWINSIKFTPLRFETTFFSSWHDFVRFNKNFKRFRVCIYWNLELFFITVNYLLFMIITIGALLISEMIDLDYILSMAQELISKEHGEEIIGVVILFSVLLIFVRIWEWWINFDEFLNENKTVENGDKMAT